METKKAATLQVGGHQANSQSRKKYALVSSEDYLREEISEVKWSLHSGGYAYRIKTIKGKKEMIYHHRQVMGLSQGQGVVDHINGNPLDCRRENLRVLDSNAHNLQNRKRGHGQSPYRGVYRNQKSGKWIGQVNTNGQHYYGGCFDDEQEAALAAEVLRRNLMPYSRPDSQLLEDFGDRLDAVLDDWQQQY